jgi:hypothetical protein
MRLPQSRTARSATAIGIAATAVLIVVGPGSTAALAGRMIGSPAIKNNTVRSIDVRNGTIKGLDVKDGSLTARDFSGTMRGTRGARGPRGLRGTQGPPGPAGTNGTGGTGAGQQQVLSWQVHHEIESGNDFTATEVSNTTVPADTQVEVVSFAIATDFDSCAATLSLRDTTNTVLASITWNSQTQAWGQPALSGGGAILTQPSTLTISGVCDYFSNPQPLPTYDATVTLAFTHRDTTATGSFN